MHVYVGNQWSAGDAYRTSIFLMVKIYAEKQNMSCSGKSLITGMIPSVPTLFASPLLCFSLFVVSNVRDVFLGCQKQLKSGKIML